MLDDKDNLYRIKRLRLSLRVLLEAQSLEHAKAIALGALKDDTIIVKELLEDKRE